MLNIKNNIDNFILILTKLRGKKLIICPNIIAPIMIISYSSGVGFYFGLSFEPNLYIIGGFLLILAIFYKKSIIISLLMWFTLGLFSTSIQANLIKNQTTLKQDLKFVKIIGTVEEITHVKNARKLILKKVQVQDKDLVNLNKVKILARTSLDNAKAGDKISIIANLMPPPSKVKPDGYDFRIRNYFDNISAVGYSVSKAKILCKAKKINLLDKITRIRAKLYSEILSEIGPKTGNIAAALMIGEYRAIDEKILNEMRIAGISHILSVSGMHLSLMAMIWFFLSRIILVLSYSYTAKLDAKKISAFFSILGSFAYLMISGLQVAAIRSFILVGFSIFAIIFDRNNLAIRALFFAGFLILFHSPEQILNPSFQMSFSAVLALLASYNLNLKKFYGEYVILNNIKFYIYSTLISSFVALISTAPYVLYHFNQFSTYSIIANLIAVPFTSFVIMPLVIISFISYPFGLFKISLKLMSYSIEILIKIAHMVSIQPKSVIYFKDMPIASLILLTFAGLIYCLFNNKQKYFSIPLALIAVILFLKNPAPVLMIYGKQNYFAYVNENNNLIFSAKKIPKFVRENWQNSLGFGSKSCDFLHKKLDYKNSQEKYVVKINELNLNISSKDQINWILSDKINFLNQSITSIEKDEVIFVYKNNNKYTLKTSKQITRIWNK